MKKLFIISMLVVFCVLSLTVCGSKNQPKNDEQSSVSEIAEKIFEEAQADGVDLKAELESDKEYYESDEYKETKEAELHKFDDVNAERDNFKENELLSLKEYYDSFLNAEDSETAKTAAENYNTLMNSVYGNYSESFTSTYMKPSMETNLLFYTSIDKEVINLKCAFVENISSDYDYCMFTYNGDIETVPSIVFYSKSDYTAPIDKLKIVLADGTVNTVDLSAYCKDETYMNFTDYVNNSVVISRGDFSGGPLVVLAIDVYTGEITELPEDYEAVYGLYSNEFPINDEYELTKEMSCYIISNMNYING